MDRGCSLFWFTNTDGLESGEGVYDVLRGLLGEPDRLNPLHLPLSGGAGWGAY